jgi:heat shock protein HtpX
MNKLNAYLKTTILLAALTALLIAIGYAIAGSQGAIMFFFFSLIMNVGSYWFSDKIAIAFAGGKPISRSQAPEIFEDLETVARRMGIPTPKLYISQEAQPNAFATGRNPQNGLVCLTAGITKALNRSELRGVIAHELAHIKNYDILTGTIAAVIAGTISSIANIAMWGFGGMNRDEERNPLVGLLLIIIAPIAATIIQLAISRTREYAADRDAAEYTKEPEYLADALEKIEGYSRQIPMDVNPAMSSLYISNPLRGQGLMNIFSTHPPIAERIKRLRSM